MDPRPPRYRAYLLRCWETSDRATWRFSLEAPGTGTRRAFATLEALVAALRCDLAGTGDRADGPTGPGRAGDAGNARE